MYETYRKNPIFAMTKMSPRNEIDRRKSSLRRIKEFIKN